MKGTPGHGTKSSGQVNGLGSRVEGLGGNKGETRTRSFNKWCWENRISTFTRVQMDPYLTAYTKIKFLVI